LRLGCLNHALLTAQAIKADGLECSAWIGSRIDPHFARAEENIETLEHRLGQPAAAIIPFSPISDDHFQVACDNIAR
jgi:dethiobiotin synthetase